jgi:quercetin dioxygenase-like cupin family protein
MELFQDVQEAPMETIAPGIRRFVFTLKQLMGVYFEIDPGVKVAEHAHPHEQMGMLIQGKTRWHIQGRERIVEAPAIYRIPSQEPHAMEVIGDKPALILDSFTPIREDFLQEGPPDYMRG